MLCDFSKLCSEIVSVDSHFIKCHYFKSICFCNEKYFMSLTSFQWKNMQIGGGLKKFCERACVCRWMISTSLPLDAFWLLFFHIKFCISDSQHLFANLPGIFVINFSSSGLRIVRTFFPCWKAFFDHLSLQKNPHKQPKLHFSVRKPSFNFQSNFTDYLYTSVHKPNFYCYLVPMPSYCSVF